MLSLSACHPFVPASATGRKALRILALEPKQDALDRKDVLIFLYAMGLVSLPVGIADFRQHMC